MFLCNTQRGAQGKSVRPEMEAGGIWFRMIRHPTAGRPGRALSMFGPLTFALCQQGRCGTLAAPLMRPKPRAARRSGTIQKRGGQFATGCVHPSPGSSVQRRMAVWRRGVGQRARDRGPAQHARCALLRARSHAPAHLCAPPFLPPHTRSHARTSEHQSTCDSRPASPTCTHPISHLFTRWLRSLPQLGPC